MSWADRTQKSIVKGLNRMNDTGFRIRAYTQKELAARYGCSTKTFRRWLTTVHHNLGPRVGYFYNPKQVKAIVEHLGEP